MGPAVPNLKNPTEGARRAAELIQRDPSLVGLTAELIDRETGLLELIETLEAILAEAGDLVESRSPELVAQARAALRRSGDSSPRAAE